MTREEAVKEIKKAFEPAFANYIIIALTEGATVSDIQHRWGRAYEAGVKDGLEQEPCKDAVSVASVFEIMGNLMSIPYDFDRSITEKDVSESMDKIRALPRVTPQEPILEKDGTLIVTTEHYKNVGRVLVQCGTNGALFYQDQEPTTKNDIRDNRVKNELNRVKDELEPTTKNNLRVDWESYKDVDGNSLDDLILEVLQNNFDCGNTYGYKVADEIIGLLPSVTPQEQDKPMVEIDLYSVIKQKYIEREVLDKIRAEINKLTVYYTTKDKGINLISQKAVNRIFDKYKAESEVSE